MRLKALIAVGALFLTIGYGQVTDVASPLRQEWAQREANGDYKFYFDIAKREKAFAVPYLSARLRLGNIDFPSEDVRTAQAALRKIPGVEDYLKSELQKEDGNYEKCAGIFNVLGFIGGDKAAAVVAPYLFDHTPPPSMTSDIGYVSTAGIALNALKGMHFPDDPTAGNKALQNSVEGYHKWLLWAVRRGFVPQDRLAEFSIPAGELTSLTPSPRSSGKPSEELIANGRTVNEYQWLAIALATLGVLGGIVFYVKQRVR